MTSFGKVGMTGFLIKILIDYILILILPGALIEEGNTDWDASGSGRYKDD